jgi:DNA repair photolyase
MEAGRVKEMQKAIQPTTSFENVALNGFRSLVISRVARAMRYGDKIARQFETAGLPVEVLSDDVAVMAELESIKRGTLVVQTAPPRGWIKVAEHGTLAVRQGERYLNPVEGCRSSCTYCYLRSFPLGLKPVRLYIDTDQLLAEIRADSSKCKSARIYCTGELADSLAEVEIYPIAAILAEHFAGCSDARLELRTKSNQVKPLLDVNHNGNTTIAFSVSPQPQIDVCEPGTASLSQRLEAAKQCQQAGYPIALKFEPLIMSNEWQIQYTYAIEYVCSLLNVSEIEHVTIGCLRWSKQLASVPSFAKQHRSTIQGGAWIEYRPGIFNGTLLRSERIAVYKWMERRLRALGIAAPIRLSLEEPDLIQEFETQ